jgi:hypothetical protein
MKSKRPGSWSDVKASLSTMDRAGLVDVVRSLYDASSANRRFLHARFVPAAGALEQYRTLVETAVFPDPFSQRPVRLRDAAAAITEYKRSTGNVAGVVDLLLTFAEAGTEQAADLGYGDEAYFGALERKVNEVLSMLDALPADALAAAEGRLIRLGEYEDRIGWGYGDFLADVAARLSKRRGVLSVKHSPGAGRRGPRARSSEAGTFVAGARAPATRADARPARRASGGTSRRR